jgi:hypothetical protein
MGLISIGIIRSPSVCPRSHLDTNEQGWMIMFRVDLLILPIDGVISMFEPPL